jgi:CTP synthase
MPKYIFVTGGVVSSVGKGITVASIGTILKSRQLSVTAQKLDPYLNVDPGTMSPYQHGEVFVTQDGAETDLDLGNYERFIDVDVTADSNVTSGQIYSAVISRERRGDFLGGTIQVVPHVTSEIKARFKRLAEKTGADVILIEVGGTVGDIEGQPFLEAIRQMRNDVGRDNVLFVHVTLLPYLNSTKELKTKPTQHSVNELRRIGIQPDVIICRADLPIPESIRDKISLFCDVQREAVIPLPTVSTIYEIPLLLEEWGLGQLIVGKLGLRARKTDLRDWQLLVERLKMPHEPVNIALVGKYVELSDAYFSVREALCHAALYHDRELNLHWVHSEDLEQNGAEALLRSAQGIVVPGGFGIRGIEGMVRAASYARANKIPYLGLCLGMQVMVIEFARFVFNSPEPNSTEFDPDTRYPVIDFMPEQRKLADKGGTMRLGNYPCHLLPGSRAYQAYQQPAINERHRHRYEFNNEYRARLEEGGMIYSGLSPDNTLVEICELAEHPWMVSCQFHPEFGSRPNRPHPLFRAFIGVARDVLREGAQPPLPLTTEMTNLKDAALPPLPERKRGTGVR